MFILTFLALVPRFLFGFLIVDSIWASRQIQNLVIKVFLALPAGVGISSLFSFVWIWAKLDLRIYVLMETFLVGLVTLLIAWKKRSDLRSFPQNIGVALNKQSSIWSMILVVGIILFVSFFWINSARDPHGKWDAWSNWNVVARFVYRGGQNWQSTFLRIYGHPDYPFLLAMSNAITWELLSKETIHGPITLAFSFTLSLVGLLFGLSNALRGSKQATLVVIVLMMQPTIAYHGMALYADIPEAFYFLASAGLIPLFFSCYDKSIAIIAGLMTGLGAWTKNEGLTFVAINLIAWVGIGILFKEKSVIKKFISGIFLPMFVIIFFKIFLAPGNDLLAGKQDILKQLLDTQRYVTIGQYAGRTSWEFGSQPIPIAAILFAYTIFVGTTRNSIQAIPPVLFTVSAQLMFYFSIFVISPHDLEWHLATSLNRLYLHVFPLVLLCLLMWIKTPDELFLDLKS